MSRIAALIKQLESYESRLETLTAKLEALEARLVQAPAADGTAGLVLIRDEATIALAEYQRQLDETPFNPEAPSVTSAMRTEHRAAVDAAERAASWIGKSGQTRDKEVYAAIGAGRKALIRLAAMREHRPVPLPLLSADELAGYVNAAADVHTADRFRWEGTGPAEILLDRPVFGKPVFVEVARVGEPLAALHVTQVRRTDRSLKDLGTVILYEPDMVDRRLADPTVTHLRIAGRTPWRARVIQADELPLMDDETTGRGGACFRHTLGATKVTMQGTVGGSMEFLPDCDCRGICDDYRHAYFQNVGSTHFGDFREDVTLPARTGMLYLNMNSRSVWSVTVIDDVDVGFDDRVGRRGSRWSRGVKSVLQRMGFEEEDL